MFQGTLDPENDPYDKGSIMTISEKSYMVYTEVRENRRMNLFFESMLEKK